MHPLRAFIILLLTTIVVESRSIPLQRLPHKITPLMPNLLGHNKYVSPIAQLGATGNSIPMKGGYFTLGTYYATVSIGSPVPQNFTVLIDTGSSNLAVPYKTCGDSCGKTSPRFDPSKSVSFNAIGCNNKDCLICSPPEYFGNTSKCVYGQPICQKDGNCGFGITYGGGSSALSGLIGKDTVCFGGYCVKNHNFILIENEYPENSFSESPIDGILGLSFIMNACNPTCTIPIYDDISYKYGLNNIFSICLTKYNGGILDIGIIDSNKYNGIINYTPIIDSRWYNINIIDILVGSYSIGVPNLLYKITNDVIGSFPDSGTSVLLMSPLSFNYLQQVYQSHYCYLPGICSSSNFFTSGCIDSSLIKDKINQFPDIEIVLEGEKGKPNFSIKVPPDSYLLPADDQYCFGIAQAVGVGVILGDVVMNNYYIVHDRINMRVGFAEISNCS